MATATANDVIAALTDVLSNKSFDDYRTVADVRKELDKVKHCDFVVLDF